MFRSGVIVCLIAVCILGLAGGVNAIVFTHNRGIWPADWPQALEPLRSSAQTVEMGTGIQEDQYWIPVADRETFVRIWPAVLSLRTSNGTLTLKSVTPERRDAFLNDSVPAIVIRAPAHRSYSVSREIQIAPGERVNYSQFISEGRALKAAPPWPNSLVGPDGSLPEYVRRHEDEQGHLSWVAVDELKDAQEKRLHGFHHRAQIDLELVIDGSVIDLNQLRLPEKCVIIDHRAKP
jgi:hypothetical protein